MESLTQLYKAQLETEKMSIERIENPETDEIQRKGDIHFLWFDHKTFALHALFIEHDLQKAKQHFWVCGLLDCYQISCYDVRILDYGVDNIAYAIFSDSAWLVQHYACLGHSAYQWMVDHGHSTLIYAQQQIMQSDWENLERALHIMNTKNKSLNNKLSHDKLFLSGILHKDITQMADGIHGVLKDHKRRNKNMGIAQQYISIPALTYTKLAWRHGFELDIRHPLIPQALLPVQPLTQYTIPYDFLRSWASQHGISSQP